MVSGMDTLNTWGMLYAGRGCQPLWGSSNSNRSQSKHCVPASAAPLAAIHRCCVHTMVIEPNDSHGSNKAYYKGYDQNNTDHHDMRPRDYSV